VRVATVPDCCGGGRFRDHSDYSFVVPIFNEEETLPEFYRQLASMLERLDGPAEIIFVDDGSHDASRALVLELRERDPRVKLVCFSRNFGHQMAITAGSTARAAAPW